MATPATQREERNNFPIDLSQPWQRRYWTKEFGVTIEELQQALDVTGSTVGDVRAYLQKKN
jgi:hypothetical protein